MLSFAAAIAAVAVGGVIVWGLASSGDRTVDTATESAEITSTSADAAGDATDAVDAVEDAAEADVDDAMEDDGVTQQEAEIAEDEEAFEEEAMEEAMEEELEPEAATADDSTSENVEERLGDDDDAADESKTTETQGSDADIEIDLDQVFGYRSLDGETAGGDGDNAGLFPLPIEERTDFLGLATSTDELAEYATGNAFSNEVSPLGGSGCVEIAARLALAQSATLVGTARIIDDVTGQPADLAVVLLEDGGAPAPIAIDINECRIYLGADDLP